VDCQAYQYDVFVSYASPDDELPPPFDRWVTRLVDGLRRTLRSRLGREPRIYFDQDTAEPNQPWSDIDAACRDSALFLAIHSPAYAARDWPQRELDLFVRLADDPRRLFVAELGSGTGQAHPALQERTFKRFFDAGESRGMRHAMPIEPDTREFANRIWDLASAIERQIRRMEEGEPVAATAAGGLESVLLAVTTDDLDDERESVRRHLEQFGISVLPTAEYPLGGAAFREAFAHDLGRSRLVVQLLGPRPGRRPPDLREGYGRHQRDAAEAAAVPVIQWRSSALDVVAIEDVDHRALLTGAEVIACTLEQFKQAVRDRLEAMREPVATAAESAVAGPSSRIVFVHAEKADAEVVRQVGDLLGAEHVVLTPLYAAPGSNQKDFRKKLSLCDALLLLYGEAGPAWMDDIMLHAIKVRRQHMPAGAVCMGPPGGKPALSVRIPGFAQLDCTSAAGDGWRLEPIRDLVAKLPA